jgi:hypothetical protein
MKKYFSIFTLLLLTTLVLNAQISKVPKQYSFEMGYRNHFSTINYPNEAMHGYGFLLDYAWQLSGLDGTKPKVFLSVPMGYTIVMPVDDLNKKMSMLNYGWTVRHELKKKGDIMPFVGYGLFLNNMKFNGTSGSVTGHQTQFEFGYNFHIKTRLQYFAKIQYSYSSYPQLGSKERIHMQYADLRVGLRF